MRLDLKLSLVTICSAVVLVLSILGLTVYSTGESIVETEKSANNALLTSKRNYIKQMITVAHTIAETSPTKEEAIARLSKLRFEGGSGYFFAYEKLNDGYGFAFHATKPHLNGTKTNIHMPDVKGKKFRVHLIEEADKNPDGGVVEYHYQNPKSKVISKKIAYSKKVNRFGWTIVTGVYMSDIKKELDLISSRTKANMSKLLFSIIVSSVIILLIISTISFIISRRLAKGLELLSNELAVTSNEAKEISDSLNDVSKTITESTSMESSSLQESSASLEELDKMTKENFTSSNNTRKSVEEVQRITNEGNIAMAKTLDAIQDIIDSNKDIDELSSIIQQIGEKTSIIDDIVFQTKLLSFNASVEAERAGEHGRGFAVVAQEVGSLAEVSGKAAKEISEIVKNSVEKSENIIATSRVKVEAGGKLVHEAADKLKQIEEKAKEVSSQIDNIVSASEEQSLGISQINEAVSHIDSSVQQNVSSVEDMSHIVKNLVVKADKLDSVSIDINKIVTGK